MDQEHRYAALTALLDREGAVRCDDGVLPSRNAHAKYPYFTCFIAVGLSYEAKKEDVTLADT